VKTHRMILLIVFVCGFCMAATQAVSSASESMRWGIVPKKSSQAEPEATAENSVTPAPSKPETDPPENSSQPMPSKIQNPEKTGSSPTARDAVPKSADPASAPPSPAMDLSRTPSSDKKAAPPVKPDPASKKKESKPISKARKITWANDQQKKICVVYLTQLHDLFLKARNYSIQGASCDTAENSTAFLQTWEKCKQECPQAFLDQSGYTASIIRNITYLEKLGNQRCDAAPEPVTPPVATHKKKADPKNP
jgi:hypothetical protein